MELNFNDKESLYLQKLENDVSERMYDLLVIHLLEADKKIRKDKAKLIAILETAIKELSTRVTEANSRFFYRYILICCNKILRFDKARQDIKDTKKRIIEEYIQSEVTEEVKIPLAYQMNEVRITFDTTYLEYLINHFIEDKLWDKALYCWIAVSIIEPDKEELPKQYKIISENIKKTDISKPKFEMPNDRLLALDANVVIPMIFYDVGDFRILESEYSDIEKISKNNILVITPSVQQEIKDHLEFQLEVIKKKCEKMEGFAFGKIKKELEDRFSEIMKKYAIKEKIPVKEENLERIRTFYYQYVDVLEKIVLEKIRDRSISKKLRKLAQRESMLPEKGDFALLSEIIELNSKNEQVFGILSNDKDLTVFAEPIKKSFGIDIFEMKS